jgi:rhodanese-related sulfurtransferase
VQALYRKYKAVGFRDAPDITASELIALRGRANPVLVDVREPREVEVSIIPGAIPKQEFEENRNLYAGRPVVVYCTIGWRSGLYASRLRREGADALNLVGGVLGWAHAGEDFFDGEDATRSLHVYGPTWNLAPDGYSTEW